MWAFLYQIFAQLFFNLHITERGLQMSHPGVFLIFLLQTKANMSETSKFVFNNFKQQIGKKKIWNYHLTTHCFVGGWQEGKWMRAAKRGDENPLWLRR